MFYPVRVKDSNGKLKKLVRSNELSKRFWKKFYVQEQEKNFTKDGENQVSPAMFKKLRARFPDLYDFPL